MDDESTTGAMAAGLPRRLAALCYDTLLLVAVAFAATAALLPLTGGEAITPGTQGAAAHLYRGYLGILALAYFAVSWTRGGQTLGMKAWKIRLELSTGKAPGWPCALLRFITGLALFLTAGLGVYLFQNPGWSAIDAAGVALLMPLLGNFGWIAFDARSRSLQDLACHSRVVRA